MNRRPWPRTPLIPPPMSIEDKRRHALAGCVECAAELGGLRKLIDEAAEMAIREGAPA